MVSMRSKGVTALIVAGSLAFGSVVVASGPAAAATADGFEYTNIDGKAKIEGCDGACPADLVIPGTVDGLPVSTIGGESFEEAGLTSVTFPDTTEFKEINDSAFSSNTLTSVTIPTSVTRVGQWSFAWNDISELTFEPDSHLTTIGRSAFDSNDLTEVTIPSAVTNLEQRAFASNSGLSQVTFEPDSQLTAIGASAFYQDSLTSFEVPSGVSSIGAGAFFQNSLTSITIPDGVASIGDAAFDGNALSSAYFALGGQLEIIGKYAFANNQLGSALIPTSVTIIDESGFEDNNLTSLTFMPDSNLVEIGPGSFADNDLQSVQIPPEVSILGSQAFRNSSELNDVSFLGGKPGALGTSIFQNTGTEPIYVRQSATPSWVGTTALSGRPVVVVPDPTITTQPKNATLPKGGTVELSVGVDSEVPGQGSLSYEWYKNGSPVSGTSGAQSLTVGSTGSYKVVVSSWTGSTSSINVTVSAPVAPKPKPVVKRKQSAKVKLPSKLKRNKSYKLPARTNAGVKLRWKVSGSGKCKVDKRRHSIKCRTATGKKHFRLTGTAKATSKVLSYKTSTKRRVH